ncbi:hypothetical protein OE88DRAFT_1667249 [Heliocybe sulcata]|uniref:GPI anchored protein n=1 Tax=Heliocybe sulcata TaxID=5364 RepID=A0A5C3MPF0_9AGAM|nr:hypothetical protein OE88DRAFT_1667249 [Heliocybe sulcata]
MVSIVACVLSAAVLSLNLELVGAQSSTSLWIPALQSDGPLSISEVGAGSDGRTTWLVGPGAASGTDTPRLPGTATLVEGPNDAYLTYGIGNVNGAPIGGAAISCAISGSQAVCADTITQAGSTVAVTTTAAVSPEVVAVASSGSASASTTASSSSSASSATSTSPSSQSSGNPSQTSSTAPSATTSTSGALAVKQVSAGIIGIAALGFFSLL